MNDARIGAGEEKEVGRSDCTAATHLLVLVRLLKLLDRHDLARLLVAALENDTVRALPDGTQVFVVLHEDT